MEDYTVTVPSPFEALMTGAQQGAGLAQLALQRQQREIELQRQQRQQQFLQDFIAKPVKTADDYARATLAIPGMREQFKQSWELQNTAQQETTKKEAGAIFSALNAGKVDFAKGLMQEKITALENSGGDPQEIKAAKTMLQAMDIDPNMARDQVGLYLTSIPGGKELIEGYTKIGGEVRARELAPVELRDRYLKMGLTAQNINKAIIEGKKLSAETQKILLDLEAIKAGVAPPEERFQQEEKLRKEFESRSKNYSESERNLAIIDASASDKTGAGDIALVTSFMKMLDPGSVVRETEFANARDTAGLMASLRNFAQKKTKGSFLDPKQRADFGRLAKEYFKAAQKKQGEDLRLVRNVIKNYNLNEENVIPKQPVAVDY